MQIYNFHDRTFAASFICKMYYFLSHSGSSFCTASHRNDRCSRSQFQLALTRFLVVLGKNSCILFYFISNKGTFEPAGQFSRKLICNLCHWKTFNNHTPFRDIGNNSLRDLQTYDVRATKRYWTFPEVMLLQTERRRSEFVKLFGENAPKVLKFDSKLKQVCGRQYIKKTFQNCHTYLIWLISPN
jgi:hypothetical protein